jgi:hypothetical protein
VKAVYTVTELARLAGISRFRMLRMLISQRVTVVQRGPRRPAVVCLSCLKRAWPDLWDALVVRISHNTARGAL